MQTIRRRAAASSTDTASTSSASAAPATTPSPSTSTPDASETTIVRTTRATSSARPARSSTEATTTTEARPRLATSDLLGTALGPVSLSKPSAPLVSQVAGLSTALTPALSNVLGLTSALDPATVSFPNTLPTTASAPSNRFSSGTVATSTFTTQTTGASTAQPTKKGVGLGTTAAVVLGALLAVFVILFLVPCLFRRASRKRRTRQASMLVADLTSNGVYPLPDDWSDAKVLAADEKAFRRASRSSRSGRRSSATWTAADASRDLCEMDDHQPVVPVYPFAQQAGTAWSVGVGSPSYLLDTPQPSAALPPSPTPEYERLTYSHAAMADYGRYGAASAPALPGSFQSYAAPHHDPTPGFQAEPMRWGVSESVYSQHTEAPKTVVRHGGAPVSTLPPLPGFP